MIMLMLDGNVDVDVYVKGPVYIVGQTPITATQASNTIKPATATIKIVLLTIIIFIFITRFAAI